MTNKKRISKLLKKKYKPSESPRKVKHFTDFKFGIDFGSLISGMAVAFNQLAKVADNFTTIDLRGWQPPVIHPIKPPPPIYMRNPFLIYPDKPEPTLPELKRRVDDLEYILKNTRVGTERWLENVRRLRKARIDFESMLEKKGKLGISETFFKRLNDTFLNDLRRHRPQIFEYNFEKEHFNIPKPEIPIVGMLENSLLKTKQYRDWRYPKNIFKEGITTFEKKGETMSGDIIYICKLTEDGFRYEIDFINKIDYTEIIGERRIRLPKYKEFW